MFAPPVWQQQPNEPNRWYGYFIHYLKSGLRRSLRSAYRDVTGGGTPSRSWRDAYHRWRWKDRAEQWDAWQRENDLLLNAVTWRSELRRLWDAVDVLARRVESFQMTPEKGVAQADALEGLHSAQTQEIATIPASDACQPICEGVAQANILESADIRTVDAALLPATIEETDRVAPVASTTIGEQIDELWQKYGLDKPREAPVRAKRTPPSAPPPPRPFAPAPENTHIFDLEWIKRLNNE